ncbi:unnamed protein product [Didymodactylos carnosus]|uniref:Metalloendopeptidase n=1 Tax=Didymodactylos carnosus TaxID=1234261 RepID=A0A813UMX0_9BILA|nr:unnamed protein product [Didymodactylos carnosus]CAF1064212.1 unnamed protein product [Didymodactylos carnosus]CAF3618477.1 unnamed protein product [Didymodactylos carnosus]CAF3829464.1 unnamed protein product [Didymodactylos carnosus]
MLHNCARSTGPAPGGGFEGDIILQTDFRGVANIGQATRWTSGQVPYDWSAVTGSYHTQLKHPKTNISIIYCCFHPFIDKKDRDSIKAAMDQIVRDTSVNNKACVGFRPKTAADKNFITIRYGTGCSAANWSGSKFVTLQKNGCFSKGTIMHELIHVLGFWHEHTSPDRDAYVSINYGNIAASNTHNFNKRTTGQTENLGLGYDYSSLMHYGSTAFSTNGKPTIVVKKAGATIGQRGGLSATDVKKIRKYYGCK